MNVRRMQAMCLAVGLLPFDVLAAALLTITDLISWPLRFRRRPALASSAPNSGSVTIQILNWDGKHLLAESLPALVAALEASTGRHEILVVDNGSTDGSVDYLRREFPQVRVVSLDRNYGFSIGNNLGLKHVQSDVVVLLNNDMLVDKNFLEPLLSPLSDPTVFAVTSQIFFPDPSRRREETGKTRARFERGAFYLWHDEIRPEDEARSSMPVFWAGGGSCAIDRRKLEAIGGFDSLYHPFYVEDADVSYQAWKRGWKCLLAPASHVFHKHRGTSRPRFGDDFVDRTIRRNQFLFVWKNVTDLQMIVAHFLQLPRSHGRAVIERGVRFEVLAFLRALMRLPAALVRRSVNLSSYRLNDRDVLKFAQ